MRLKEKNKGGEKASSLNTNRHRNRLINVRYMDHVFFRNSDPNLYKSPNVREAVGWLYEETDEVLVLIADKSVKQLPHEISRVGLTILKSDILEIKEIEQ